MDHLGKVKIYLESGNVIAGDYLKGWVIIKCNHDGHKVILSTSATETFKVTQNSGAVNEKSSTIFAHSETLTPKTTQIEETFPFKLKVPRFCPSSFSFTYVDDDRDQRVEAAIIYNLTSFIETSEGKIAEKSKKFVVISKKSLKTSNSESNASNKLTSCWCIPKGQASILVRKTEDDNSYLDNQFKYNMKISSDLNKKLQSVVAQVVFEFISKIPGEKSLKIRKTITRIVPNLADFQKELGNNQDLNLDLDFSAADEKSSQEYSSCKARYFNSRILLRICTIYDIGWRSKFFDLDHEIFVCPKKSNENRSIKEDDDSMHKVKTITVSEANSEFYS